MGCHWLKLPDGTVAHIRTSGRTKQCYKCTQPSEFQCDFPTHRTQGGKVLKTCDRHLCRTHVSHGVTKGIDFCDEHYPIAKEAYEKRKTEEC